VFRRLSEEEEMRRTLFAVVVFLVLLGIAQLCEAGNVETKKSKGITISGEIKLDSIFANREVNTVIYGPTLGGKRQSSATFSDPTITLNLAVWLAKQVEATLTLKTPEYMFDDLGSPATVVSTPGGGATVYPSRLLEVDQAFVNIKEFGFKELSFKLGIQDIIFDLRENGNPFFLAIGRSEDPFLSTLGGLAPFQQPGSGIPELNGPGLASSVEAGGVRLTYAKKGEDMQFRGDAIFATTVETRQVDADREVIALVGTISVPHEKDCKAKIMATLASISQNPASRIWTFGLGTTFKATDSLEFFVEGYGQGGMFWKNFNPGVDPPNISTQTKDIHQQAFGGYTGFLYTAKESDWKWHLGAEWWWLSGDPNRADRKQQCFISYEDVDDTIILEENNYGYDLDTDYSAIKLRAGFKPGRDWDLDLLYGTFETARAVKPTNPAFKGYDKIGDELDIQVKWDYTEDISFRAGLGLLWNTKFFKQQLGSMKTHELLFFEAVLRF
jgi:hypothetical protein